MKWMFLEVFGNGAFSGVYEFLNVALIGGDKYTNATALIKTAYQNLMVPIALSLLVIFFVCALVEKTAQEQSTYEQMFLLFAKLIVGVFLIDKGFDLLMEFQQVGLAFLNDFKVFSDELGLDGSGLNIDTNPDLQELYQDYTGAVWPDEPGWLDAIKIVFGGGGFTLFISFIFTFIVKAAVYLIVFMRILEIYIRTMFAPIALSDMFFNGLNSTGFRFLKGYLAVSLQLVIIYGCILLNEVLMADLAIEVSKGAFLFKYLGLTCATIGILFKSQSLIKEFLGAN